MAFGRNTTDVVFALIHQIPQRTAKEWRVRVMLVTTNNYIGSQAIFGWICEVAILSGVASVKEGLFEVKVIIALKFATLLHCWDDSELAVYEW